MSPSKFRLDHHFFGRAASDVRPPCWIAPPEEVMLAEALSSDSAPLLVFFSEATNVWDFCFYDREKYNTTTQAWEGARGEKRLKIDRESLTSKEEAIRVARLAGWRGEPACMYVLQKRVPWIRDGADVIRLYNILAVYAYKGAEFPDEDVFVRTEGIKVLPTMIGMTQDELDVHFFGVVRADFGARQQDLLSFVGVSTNEELMASVFAAVDVAAIPILFFQEGGLWEGCMLNAARTEMIYTEGEEWDERTQDRQTKREVREWMTRQAGKGATLTIHCNADDEDCLETEFVCDVYFMWLCYLVNGHQFIPCSLFKQELHAYFG